ncbi:glycosyltransferase [Actinocrinis puniceicyclus]|uniref:Glycosyltransferase n=1 Tax=Actinocrinis puniceicyclus TaxID=977794 RepID=A0A8J7WN40_9ACTN|nr:glycosyltransferase [Actinocrinis puniceicyclus]MBS2962464.1 glycosyltransferase [Actinocrinis puniceicyclus]
MSAPEEPTAAQDRQALSPAVTAILTAYHPDERLVAVVESALADCTRVIVADNTPAGAPTLASKLDDPRIEVIAIGSNLGLGGALNVAVKHLPDAGAQAVLLLDQDSVLPEGLVPGLAAHLRDDPAVGIAAPTPWDAKHEKFYNVGAGLHETTVDREAVITSGMLVRRDLIDRIPFREDLFNDFVDIAFCVDVRRTGARIVQDYRIKLPHSMGDRREHKLGPLRVRVIHYPAWRHYWIARNGMRFAMDNVREHPLGFLPMAVFLGRKFLSTTLFEPDRRHHLPALARGVRDGVMNRAAARYLPEGANPPGLRIRGSAP